MADYQLNTANSVIRTSDKACIPMADGNADYQAYQTWIAAGNTPDPAPVVPPPPVDNSLSSAAILAQALIDKNIITQTDIQVVETRTGSTFDQSA